MGTNEICTDTKLQGIVNMEKDWIIKQEELDNIME